MRIKLVDSCTVINSMFTSFMVSQLLVASKGFVNLVVYKHSILGEHLVSFYSAFMYNTSISISQPENRRLNTMCCFAEIRSVPFIIFNFNFIFNKPKRTHHISMVTTQKVCLEYTAELLCKEISTLGYCYILRKTFALQATRAINVG